MARRSSARLRNRNSSTITTPIKRVSSSHDAPTARTPRTVPAKLTSVEESDEMPGAFPRSVSPSAMPNPYPTLPGKNSRTALTETPTKTTPIKPSEQEMHPQLHHQTTAKPLDEARHLGFSSMAPHTEPAKQKKSIGTLQATPSRTRNLQSDLKSPSFQFTFHREHSLELSPEAKKLMTEQREKAARIREQMIADGEGLQSIDEVMSARRIATPKGRFSQVHLKEFEQMKSIAGHASAFRADPNRSKPASEKKAGDTKSLKRSPSEARLDDPDTPSRPNSREGPKPTPSFQGSALLRSTSTKDLKAAVAGPSSPAKRVKRAETDDVSARRPPSSDSDKSVATTPRQLPSKSSIPNLSALTTPTQASLARAASVKSIKTSKIPGPQFTPAKIPTLPVAKPVSAAVPEEKTATPLLARSPAKAPTVFATKPSVTAPVEKPSSMMSPSFARTQARSGLAKKTETEQAEVAPKEKPVPFLSRSPMKAAVVKSNEEDPFQEKKSAIPFFARSPAKLPMAPVVEGTPEKSASNKLLGRFNLLRQSPMKSILRSPQRLYSDDPNKVAAGTHLATPPGKRAADLNKALPTIAPTTVTAAKRVDFTSSTKARDQRSQERSSSESKTPTPSPKNVRTVQMADAPEPEKERTPEQISYPQLPLQVPTYDRVPSLSPSPQKRRQTAGPGDFTFRADSNSIVFSQSPNAPASESQKKRPSTIRYVSADAVPSPAPATGSKKRKFEFENTKAASSIDKIVSPAQGTKKRKFEFENKLAAAKTEFEDVEMASDKENTPAGDEEEEQSRPAKRVKQSAPSPKIVAKKAPSATAPTASSAARRTTLGVKPKGTKTVSPVKKQAPRPSTTISASRLAALAQPKKRG